MALDPKSVDSDRANRSAVELDVNLFDIIIFLFIVSVLEESNSLPPIHSKDEAQKSRCKVKNLNLAKIKLDRPSYPASYYKYNNAKEP
jgi:hypothetical protein